MTYLLETIKRTHEQYLWEEVGDNRWKLLFHKLKVDKNWKKVNRNKIWNKAYSDFPKDGYKLLNEKDLFVLFL